MEVCRRSSWLLLLLGVSLLAAALQGVQGEAESEGPSESECRPYIEKALKELEVGEAGDETGDSNEDIPTVEVTTDDSDHQEGEGDDDTHEEGNASTESEQHSDEQEDTKEEVESVEQERSAEDSDTNEETEGSEDSKQSADDKNESVEEKREDVEAAQAESVEDQPSKEEENDSKVDDNDSKADDNDSKAEDNDSKTGNDSHADDNDSKADDNDSKIDDNDSKADDNDSKVNDNDSKADDNDSKADENDSKSDDGSKTDKDSKEDDKSVETEETKTDDDDDDDSKTADSKEGKDSPEKSNDDDDSKEEASEDGDNDSKESEEAPEEELTLETEVPNELRPRDHVEHLLKLDPEASEKEAIINRVSEITLRDLKKLYENAIKPLETLYKYRDLSNRHFGDAEIFSKPLILFMGPWSGGKSSIINYLLDNEYNETSLRTGAEPSPAYFNILMHGEEPEIVEGTELAADFTFSGLQKFGQGLEERLRGVKLPSELLEKVNIVEIPGILEVRKQVSRVFPFNDACQWFIDRADIIFLVYDPSKLDVGPETEAILDQLKGREHQTRIVLNKADQVKPEELMRVQGALIWNISPLMSSPQPPIMYTVSLWSKPYEPWAPVRLLKAQERAFLRDLRSAIDKRIDNKIASARRFAVRVRNHAKMVDCYLTTYYNHKSVFGNRNQVADEIIDHPQDYHIYEGLSTLTNISRYDLPDPEVYRDFFKLNALYDFKQLSATCTYFRGCPINRLDIAIAYDLPELVGKHKRLVESALTEANQEPGS